MKYTTMFGDYLEAYQFCLQNGGQLFVGNGKDSANVVVIGSNCYTFWKADSKRLLEVKDLALQFGINPEGQTGGRIARWIIDDLLKLPYEKTFWSKTYRNLAKSGKHWHYLYCQEKESFWGLEIDLKSAYFSSLFSFKSMLFHPLTGYLSDNNALDNLKILYPQFPKWFRLQFLGCLSSWRVFYFCRDKTLKDSKELIQKQRYFIKYNAAFNVAHRAILRNYKIMKKLHEIGGKHIRRIHTDSLLVDSAITLEVEQRLFAYIEDKGLKYSIKGFGRCFFWDVNTGFIGNKFVGAPIDVSDNMRAMGLKMASKRKNNEVLEDYEVLVQGSVNASETIASVNTDIRLGSTQCELFDTRSYDTTDYFASH